MAGQALNSKRRTWEACKQDEELARIVQYLGERGMLGRGAEIAVKKPDGEVVRWRDE